jgi:hypothetical protein
LQRLCLLQVKQLQQFDGQIATRCCVPVALLQVLEAHDRPLMFRLHQLGASECHFAYRMLVVLMRRDLSMAQVSCSSSSSSSSSSGDCAVLVDHGSEAAVRLALLQDQLQYRTYIYRLYAC